jgi:Leucine-rich repeat (LRR) protein
MDNNLLTFPTAALDMLPTLTSLTLNYNRISALTPMKLQNLTELNLSHNLIRQIPQDTFSNFPTLRQLNLHGNLIESLEDVIFPAELTHLDVGLNSLKSIPRFQLAQLRALNVEQNVVQSLLPHNFVLLGQLVDLNIKSNLISLYAENTFDGLQSVENIDLSNNQIRLEPKLKFCRILFFSAVAFSAFFNLNFLLFTAFCRGLET